jgi:hypothetical protein
MGIGQDFTGNEILDLPQYQMMSTHDLPFRDNRLSTIWHAYASSVALTIK